MARISLVLAVLEDRNKKLAGGPRVGLMVGKEKPGRHRRISLEGLEVPEKYLAGDSWVLGGGVSAHHLL